MCRRPTYVFLTLGLCLGVARGDLTMVPLSTWNITGDFGDVLALNGYPVDRLIVGKTVFANPPGLTATEPAENADDFSLKTAASADGEAWVNGPNGIETRRTSVASGATASHARRRKAPPTPPPDGRSSAGQSSLMRLCRSWIWSHRSCQPFRSFPPR